MNALTLTTAALLTDTQLPVKVEAAIALQILLTDQEEKVGQMLTAQVCIIYYFVVINQILFSI